MRLATAITLKNDFIHVRSIFGRKRSYPISDLDKIYVKSTKNPIPKFAVYFVVVFGINLFSFLLLDLITAYVILALSVVHNMYFIEYLSTFRLFIESTNTKPHNVRILYCMKDETILKVREVRSKIQAQSLAK